jgi:hypothetical protein
MYIHTAASSRAPASIRKPTWLRASFSRTLSPGRLSTSTAGVDAIADARLRGDDPRRAEPFAQGGDGDADGVGEGVGVLVPGALQQLFGADDPALGGDEDFEHGELLAGERDVAPVAEDLAAEGIQPQARDLVDRGPGVRASAVQRPQPHHELAEFERFGEVVVGAELEPGDLVVDPVGGGEHEDRAAAAGGDDVTGDLVAGRAGDVAVEDREVVGVHAEQCQRGVAVTGDVRGDRLQPETVTDGFGQVGLVPHDQHTHVPRRYDPTRIADMCESPFQEFAAVQTSSASPPPC